MRFRRRGRGRMMRRGGGRSRRGHRGRGGMRVSRLKIGYRM